MHARKTVRQKNNRRLLAMMPVRNEARRYLIKVLNHLAEYVDGIVILDDASDDETPTICRHHPAVINYRRLGEPVFLKDESALRRLLWEMTAELEPAWILALDADEIIEKRAKTELPALMNGSGYDLVRFPVYHLWGKPSCYRADKMWHPVLSRTACLFRYKKELVYNWPHRELHCGRFPREAYERPAVLSPLRLFHLGYLTAEDRIERFRRYRERDPEGKFCPLEHYRSLTDHRPRLRRRTGSIPEVNHETG